MSSQVFCGSAGLLKSSPPILLNMLPRIFHNFLLSFFNISSFVVMSPVHDVDYFYLFISTQLHVFILLIFSTALCGQIHIICLFVHIYIKLQMCYYYITSFFTKWQNNFKIVQIVLKVLLEISMQILLLRKKL